MVELEGGDAEVEDDPVEPLHAAGGEQRHHVAEPALDQVQAAGVAGRQRGAARDRVGVAVDRVQGAARRGVEDGGRVAAAAEGAVEEGGAVARGERRDRLPQHDREVGAAAAAVRGGRGAVAGNAAHAAPPSASSAAASAASAARQRSAFQIWKNL